MTGVPTHGTRALLRTWLRMQTAHGDSVLLTNPEPWAQGIPDVIHR